MFYILNMIFALYALLLYAVFRVGIYNHLRSFKVSKTYINKNRKGTKNYWLYLKLNRELRLGKLFYLNIAFMFALMLYSAVTVLPGYLELMKFPIALLALILLLIEITSVIFASVSNNRAEFGTAFILCKKSKYTNKYQSSVIDLLSWVPSAFLLYLSRGYIFGS